MKARSLGNLLVTSTVTIRRFILIALLVCRCNYSLRVNGGAAFAREQTTPQQQPPISSPQSPHSGRAYCGEGLPHRRHSKTAAQRARRACSDAKELVFQDGDGKKQLLTLPMKRLRRVQSLADGRGNAGLGIGAAMATPLGLG
jgi:hypothetical protein